MADDAEHARTVLRGLRKRALRSPWTGQQLVSRQHVWDTDALTEPGRPTRVMLTWDKGHHSSGWWRNSDYEFCFHLSVSHPTQLMGADLRPEAPSDAEVRAWARAAFGEHVTKTWTEPPASALDPYRMSGVAHVRLFTDAEGHPIQPEGEVYDLKPWSDGTSPEKVFR